MWAYLISGLLTGRGQSNEDAPITMNELTDHDKMVLGRLLEAIGFSKGVLGDRRQSPVDHKYLGRIIENIAVQIRCIEAELDQFAKEWGYE